MRPADRVRFQPVFQDPVASLDPRWRVADIVAYVNHDIDDAQRAGIISDDMLRNVAHTNPAEALDLFSLKLLVYLGLLGIAPAVAVAWVPVQWRGWRRETVARLKLPNGAVG